MKLFIILLFVSYASAGIITGFTTRHELGKAGNTRTSIKETKTIHTLSGGKIIAYLVPYSKKGVFTDIVEIIWQSPKNDMYSLDMLTVNWPNNEHKISAVESFIHPQSIDKKLTITIQYVKLSGRSTRTYTYNSKKDSYTVG